MKSKPKILVICLLHLACFNVHAQDPVFSHFFANPVHLNPAMAGKGEGGRLVMGYRNQWPNTGASFVTYHSAYDNYYEKLHGGLGVNVMNDQQGNGAFNTFMLNVSYAYHGRLGRELYFSGALKAGGGQRSFNFSNLVFGDMINPVTGAQSGILTENLDANSHFFPDFGSGVAFFYKNIYGGIVVNHLLEPDLGSNGDLGSLHRLYTVHAGMMIPVIEQRRGVEIMKLSPNIVFMQQSNIQQLTYGIDLIYSGFMIGLWARNDFRFTYGNILFTTGYELGPVKLRYTYDVKLNSPTIRIPTLGAHELSLVFLPQGLDSRKKRRTIKCPKI